MEAGRIVTHRGCHIQPGAATIGTKGILVEAQKKAPSGTGL
jgi:hypothetical protein